MSGEFERFDHGPITFYRMTRKVPGNRPMRVGVYVVDGLMIDTGPRGSREAIAAILTDLADLPAAERSAKPKKQGQWVTTGPFVRRVYADWSSVGHSRWRKLGNLG